MNFKSISNFFAFMYIKFLGYRHKKEIDLLVNRGLRLGKNVTIGRNACIDPDVPWLISIGDDCIIASNTMILAHDATTKRHIGYTKIKRVLIGRNAFIGVGSIILPGVCIGDNVIIGAGSVVTKDVPSNSIAIGNPAHVIGLVSNYINKHRENLSNFPVYGEGWTLKSNISYQNKLSMYEECKENFRYII